MIATWFSIERSHLAALLRLASDTAIARRLDFYGSDFPVIG
jgi:hypothetical protein